MGNGYEISIKDLAFLIAKLMKKKIRIKKSIKRLRSQNSEVKLLKSSSKRFTVSTKWKPKFKGRKGLEEGLKKQLIGIYLTLQKRLKQIYYLIFKMKTVACSNKI